MLSDETHNKKSLAARYGVSYKKFNTWMETLMQDKSFSKKFGTYSGGAYTPKQLTLIEEELGAPPVLKVTA